MKKLKLITICAVVGILLTATADVKAVLDTRLSLQFDGINGQTTTTDSSPQSHAMTLNGAAHLDTAFYKYGTASLQLDGTNDSASSPDSPDWDIFGSSADDWTIDFWAKFTDHTGSETIISQRLDNGNRWSLTHIGGAGYMFIMRSVNSTKIYSADTAGGINDSNWHHTALCKVGPEYAIYVDGNQMTYISDTDTKTLAAVLEIGRLGTTEYFNGHLDELRITHDNLLYGADPDPQLSNKIKYNGNDVPEPATMALLGLGVLGLLRRKKT